jgi:hypothetical protein
MIRKFDLNSTTLGMFCYVLSVRRKMIRTFGINFRSSIALVDKSSFVMASNPLKLVLLITNLGKTRFIDYKSW